MGELCAPPTAEYSTGQKETFVMLFTAYSKQLDSLLALRIEAMSQLRGGQDPVITFILVTITNYCFNNM